MTGDPDPSLLLHARFGKRAALHPDAIALHYGDRSVTYRALEAAALELTRRLDELGMGPGHLVGVHVPRSPEWVAAVLGVLQSGAAVVPLPPDYPSRRLEEICEYGELELVIDSAGTPAAFAFDGPAVTIAELAADPAGPAGVTDGAVAPVAGAVAPEPAPNPVVDPDSPAFVLSSSGSTGHPKLIVRSHRSFFHRLHWTWRRHPFADGELGCQKAHMTTTHALYELLEPLLAGAPTVIVSDEEARNLERFWDTVRARGVTRLLIVPSALRASLEVGVDPPPLEVVVLMGEYVAPDLAEQAVESFPRGTHLYSIYGSTEASSALVVDLRESLVPGQELPLGVPIAPEVEAFVLDDEDRPVPPGEAGRLYLAGMNLFSGYLNDPELTAAVLVDVPVHPTPVYDTRDRVRRSDDGSLHFVGRVDHTIKVRGFRVELPEVERAIRDHPGVRQAAVVVSSEGTAAATLTGFYLPADIDVSSVYETVRDRLPDYMVPSALIGLDEFPLTSSAKVDRVRLEEEYGSPEPGFQREPSETETRVADVWADTLGHRRFRLDTSFFEAGGSSLSVFTMVHRLREVFGLDRTELDEEAVYRASSVEGLAALIDGVRSGTPAPRQDTVPVAVTLHAAGTGNEDRPPLFLVPSAGGTLGAYERLTHALGGEREVIGLRDPYLWGDRPLAESFDRWTDRFLDAVRARQPVGPYNICAYSSAGSFGYEMARRLIDAGQEVALVLVDPLVMDRTSRWRYGYWALRATWMRPPLRALVRLAGRVRTPLVRAAVALGIGTRAASYAPSEEEAAAAAEQARTGRGHLMNLAALLELNTGLPYALVEDDFDGVPPDEYLRVLTDRVAEVTPEVDPERIERLVVQYAVQARAQHAYHLRPYRGRVVLVEPETRYAGLVVELLRPWIRDLDARKIPIGPPSTRERIITKRFGALATHFRSMRDETFARGLAREVREVLR